MFTVDMFFKTNADFRGKYQHVILPFCCDLTNQSFYAYDFNWTVAGLIVE